MGIVRMAFALLGCGAKVNRLYFGILRPVKLIAQIADIFTICAQDGNGDSRCFLDRFYFLPGLR